MGGVFLAFCSPCSSTLSAPPTSLDRDAARLRNTTGWARPRARIPFSETSLMNRKQAAVAKQSHVRKRQVIRRVRTKTRNKRYQVPYITVQYSTVQYSTDQNRTEQYSTVQYSTLPRSHHALMLRNFSTSEKSRTRQTRPHRWPEPPPPALCERKKCLWRHRTMKQNSQFRMPNGVLHCSMSPQACFLRSHCARGGNGHLCNPFM